MNPEWIVLALRGLIAATKEAPAAQADVNAAPDTFSKAIVALTHFENFCAGMFGSFEEHAATLGVPTAPPAGG